MNYPIQHLCCSGENGCVYFSLLRTQFRFLKAWKALPMDTSFSKFCHRLRAEQFLGDSQAVHFNSFPQGPQCCPTTQISVEAAPSNFMSSTKGVWMTYRTFQTCLHESLGTSSIFCKRWQRSSAPPRETITEHWDSWECFQHVQELWVTFLDLQ